MKALMVIGVLVASVGGWFWWNSQRKAGTVENDANVGVRITMPGQPVRTWTSQDGRTFEGALVAALPRYFVVQRHPDQTYFRMLPEQVSEMDSNYVAQAKVPRGDVPGVYWVLKKLAIPSFVVRLPDPSSPNGVREDRFDARHFALLAGLSGSNAQWVRLTDDLAARITEDGIVAKPQLANVLRGDRFMEALPWPRPEVTVADAVYGLAGKYQINVTHAMMRVVSGGEFPVELKPEIFELEPHPPEVWELAVTWRTPNGRITKRVKDGSILTWP